MGLISGSGIIVVSFSLRVLLVHMLYGTGGLMPWLREPLRLKGRAADSEVSVRTWGLSAVSA